MEALDIQEALQPLGGSADTKSLQDVDTRNLTSTRTFEQAIPPSPGTTETAHRSPDWKADSNAAKERLISENLWSSLRPSNDESSPNMRGFLPATPIKRSPLPSPGLSGLRSASYSLIPSPMAKAPSTPARAYSSSTPSIAVAEKCFPEHVPEQIRKYQVTSSDADGHVQKPSLVSNDVVVSPIREGVTVSKNRRKQSSRNTSQQKNSPKYDDLGIHETSDDMSPRHASQALISQWEESLHEKDIKLDEAYHRVSLLQSQLEHLRQHMQDNEDHRARAERETEQVTVIRDALRKDLRKYEDDLVARNLLIEEQSRSLEMRESSQSILENKFLSQIQELEEQKRVAEFGSNQRQLTIMDMQRKMSVLSAELQEKSRQLSQTQEERDIVLEDSVQRVEFAAERQQLHVEIEALQKQLEANERIIKDIHDTTDVAPTDGVSLFHELDADSESFASDDSDFEQAPLSHYAVEPQSCPLSAALDDVEPGLDICQSAREPGPHSEQKAAVKADDVADYYKTEADSSRAQSYDGKTASSPSHQPVQVSYDTVTAPSLSSLPFLSTSTSSPVSLHSPNKAPQRGHEFRYGLAWPPSRAASTSRSTGSWHHKSSDRFGPVLSSPGLAHSTPKLSITGAPDMAVCVSSRPSEVFDDQSREVTEAKKQDTMRWTQAQQALDDSFRGELIERVRGRTNDRYRRFGQRFYSDDMTPYNNRVHIIHNLKDESFGFDIGIEPGTEDVIATTSAGTAVDPALNESCDPTQKLRRQPHYRAGPIIIDTSVSTSRIAPNYLMIIAWVVLILSMTWTLLRSGEGAFGTGGYEADNWLTRRAQSAQDLMREWLRVRPDIVT